MRSGGGQPVCAMVDGPECDQHVRRGVWEAVAVGAGWHVHLDCRKEFTIKQVSRGHGLFPLNNLVQ